MTVFREPRGAKEDAIERRNKRFTVGLYLFLGSLLVVLASSYLPDVSHYYFPQIEYPIKAVLDSRWWAFGEFALVSLGIVIMYRNVVM